MPSLHLLLLHLASIFLKNPLKIQEQGSLDSRTISAYQINTVDSKLIWRIHVLSIASCGASRIAYCLPHSFSPSPLLLRFPALSHNKIAFRYADDIWTVSRQGGEATRLTAIGAVTAGPYFSPDGSEVAYSAQVNGGEDVYIVSVNGGVPRRITWHPAGNEVVGWTPDGKDLLIASLLVSPRHFARLFRIHADGTGVPVALPLPEASKGSFSPDGESIAYEPISKWQPAWKRDVGGQTSPIWIVNLKSLDLVKVPRENSNDSYPVWVGEMVYFLSIANQQTKMRGRFRSGSTIQRASRLIKF